MTKRIRLSISILVCVVVAVIAAAAGWLWWQQSQTPPTPQPTVYQAGNITWTFPIGWQVATEPFAQNIRGQAVTDATGVRVAMLYCPALTAQGDQFWQFTSQARTYERAGVTYAATWYEGTPTEDGAAHDAVPYTTHVNVLGAEATDSCTIIAVGAPWSASEQEKRSIFEQIYQQVQ